MEKFDNFFLFDFSISDFENGFTSMNLYLIKEINIFYNYEDILPFIYLRIHLKTNNSGTFDILLSSICILYAVDVEYDKFWNYRRGSCHLNSQGTRQRSLSVSPGVLFQV